MPFVEAQAMTTAIAVMAKAPRAGRSKTRLLPLLTGEEAATLSAAFLRDVTGNLAAAARTRPIISYCAYAPAEAEAAFAGLLADGTRMLLADGAGDAPAGVEGFGRCLLHAIRAMLAHGHAAACVLNADSPTLPTRALIAAADALHEPGDRVVMGPAEDGGYYLLGVKHPHAGLFADIDWSTDRVAAQTRQRAAELGLDLIELEPWYDVDEPGSLDRLARELAAGDATMNLAPCTAACLDRLDIETRRRAMRLAATQAAAGARPCP